MHCQPTLYVRGSVTVKLLGRLAKAEATCRQCVGDVPVWRTWAAGPQLVVTCNMRDAPGRTGRSWWSQAAAPERSEELCESAQTLGRHVVTAWVMCRCSAPGRQGRSWWSLATRVMHLGEQAAAGGHKLLLQKDQKNHASQQTLRRHVVTAWVIYCTL